MSNYSHMSGHTSDDQMDQPAGLSGPPIIQWFNKTDQHDESIIANGGYGLKVIEGFDPPADFGPVETISHSGGRSSLQAVTTELEFAIIGVTPRYCKWYLDGDRAKPPVYIDPEFMFEKMVLQYGGKAENGISLFVVLKCDPNRDLYELPFKTYAVEDATRIVEQTKWANSKVAKRLAELGDIKAGSTLALYNQWIKVGVGPTTKEGSGEKGNCTHPEIIWPNNKLALREYWKKYATIKKKITVADDGAQRAFVSTFCTPDDLIARIPAPEDLDIFAQQKIAFKKMMDDGYRFIYSLKDIDGILSKKSGYLPSGSPDQNFDEDGGEQSGGGSSPAEGTVSYLVTHDPKFTNTFFMTLSNSYKINPKQVLAALGINNLGECMMALDEAYAAIEAKFGKKEVVQQ